MKNLVIPKNCKFKKVPKTMPVYIQAGYVSNGHWIFKIDWLLSQKNTRGNGLQALKNRVLKEQVKATQGRLNGLTGRETRLVDLVSELPLELYKPLDTSTIEFETGYFKGRAETPSECVLAFTQKNTPILDIEYAAMLFFDGSAATHFKSDNYNAPIIIKSGNEVVAVLMPMKKENFNSTK